MARSVLSSVRSEVDSRDPCESTCDAAFAAFRAVLSAYIVGKTQLPAVRCELYRCLAASHERAVSMLHYLRVANESGLVKDAVMKLLVTDIQAAVDAGDHGIEQGIEQGIGHRLGDAQYYFPATSQRTLFAGRFEICARVGKGGIGEVFLGRDLRRLKSGCHDPRVAIKIIQRQHSDCPDAIRSLQREAVNAQCLVHPGIRRVYELGKSQNRFMLVMQWLDGETLATRLDRTTGQPMPFEAFHAMTLQIGSALSFAHRHGIVHGDIKPGNIFMTRTGDSKLLDFGHTEGCGSPTGFTPFALTRGYSSIEVLEGSQVIVSDDVYSLSVMAYRMLAGRRPFGRLTAIDAAARGLEPKRPPMLSVSQWRVLRAGLALRRQHRLTTVSELCDGLLFSPVDPSFRPCFVVAA